MQKSELLQHLSEKLRGSELSSEQVERTINDMREFLDSLPPEELEKELNGSDDLDQTAQALLVELHKQQKARVPTDCDRSSMEETKHIPIHREPRGVARVSAQPASDKTVKIDTVSASVHSNPSAVKASVSSTSTPSTVSAGNTVSAPSTPARSTMHATRSIKYSDLDQFVAIDSKNRIIFWCAVALLSPLLLFLIAVVLGVFLFAFFAMASIIAACIVALIAIVGAGTGIALFGLIYGTMQLFSAAAAGLYEIGIAIKVIGISLFSGILLYNVAIRLMPYLMHYLYEFFCFVVRKGVQLFQFIKRECTGK